MIREVIAIWACEYYNRAFGYKNKLPWSNYKIDLEILDQVLSGANHIVASRQLVGTLPKRFKDKWPNIIECSTSDPIDKVLLRLTGKVVVLGGRTVFQEGIDKALFDHLLENQLFFPRRTKLEWDTVAPTINSQLYKLKARQPALNHVDEGLFTCHWEKKR